MGIWDPLRRLAGNRGRGEGVTRWLGEVYPVIQARAQLEDAEIHWVRSAALPGADEWSRAGERGTVMSTVTNQGHRHWMVLPGVFNAPSCIDFLRRLAEPG